MIKFISSVLFVNDIAKSRMFYEEFMNQQVEIDYGVNIGYVGGFSIWRKDVAYQNIFKGNETKTVKFCNKEQQVELYFEVESLDELYERFKDNQVEFVHDYFVQPWGQRVFRVYDPDNYIIELAEPMNVVIRRYHDSGMTLEEVAEMSSTPIDIVRSIVGNF